MNIDYKERKEFKDYHEERRQERRLSLIKYVTLSILVIYLLGFWFLQIIKGKDFSEQAKNNYLETIVLRPVRGLIKDRNGKIIATSKPSFNILLSRENNPNIYNDIHGIASRLEVNEEDIKLRLEKMKDLPETEPLLVKEDVSFEEMAYIESRMGTAKKFRYILVNEESKRYYHHTEAAHILGYIGEASEKEINGEDLAIGDIIGKAGIEKRYDRKLRGVKGKKVVEVDSIGRKLRDAPYERVLPVQGLEINLTIDIDLQKELVEAFRDEIGAAVFMDPDNGEIFAIYSSPSYDPNEFAGHLTYEKWKDLCSDPNHPLLNRATQASYPPGSTFKILVAITALERRLINEKTTFYCPGSVTIYGRRHYCWHKGGHGFVNLHKAIVHSCNIYFYNLGKLLDIDDIHQFANKFGFGKKSGIDLDYELSGFIPNRAWKRGNFNEPWFPGETISVSIGQGPIQVTPIQMARFISIIGNGGQEITPHINKDFHGDTTAFIGISDWTLRIIKKAIWGVVNEKGTGWRAKLEDIEVCGKTGTAQISAATALKDSKSLPKEEREHAWFIGFAPKNNPMISFAIIVEHGGYGGETAAPIAKQVLEAFFKDDDEKEKKKQNTEEEFKRASLKKDAEKTIWQN